MNVPNELDSPGAKLGGLTSSEFRTAVSEEVMVALVGASADLVANSTTRGDVLKQAAVLSVAVAEPLWLALSKLPWAIPATESLRVSVAIRCVAPVVARTPGAIGFHGETRRAIVNQAVQAAVAAADAILAEL